MRIILLFIIIPTSCQIKHKDDSEKVYDNYLNNHGLKKNDTTFYTYKGATYKLIIDSFRTAKTIKDIYGYLAHNPNSYGPLFRFDINGKLEKYCFMSGDGKHNLYDISFDSNKDQYEELGNAFVDYLAPEIISDTGNNFTFIFSTFPRNDLEVFYSKDKLHFDTLHLTKNVTIPFITDGDVILTKNEIIQGILIKVKAINPVFKLKGLDVMKETIDTVDFK